MTQLSGPWPDTTDPGPQVGDGRPYTAAEWDQFWEALFARMDGANVALLPGCWNELECTVGGANQIDVDTGLALVKGKLYWNDASVSLTPSSAGAGNTRHDSVILQCDWDGSGDTEQYTVRVVTKQGDTGDYPSMTQTDNTLWEIEIYQYDIDDAGAITNLTDKRSDKYIQMATVVSTEMLLAAAVTAAKIADGAVETAKLADAAVTAAKLAAAVAGDGLDGGAGSALTVDVSDFAGAGLEDDGSENLRIADGGVTEAKLAAAVSAQLVTNGDSHDHNGGDGASIPNAALDGSPTSDHTADTLVLRDGDGRFQADDPSANQDVATKAYADSVASGVLPSGVILIWSGSIANIPAGYVLCDGTNSTPDLRDRFVVGAGDSYAVGDTGGQETVDLQHDHQAELYTGYAGEHSHSVQTAAVAGDHGSGTDTIIESAGPTGTESDHRHYVYVDTNNALSATAENRPPYYALAYIMKT